jgi:lipid A 3-O-deacylase
MSSTVVAFAATFGSFGPASRCPAEDLSALKPTQIFFQAGTTESNTRSYVIGSAWDWRWRRDYRFISLKGYSEIALGRWTGVGAPVRTSIWVTQVGLTPTLRIAPAYASGLWFAELGIGANVILPLYHNADKRFSTNFNFGDHLGVGVSSGVLIPTW